MSPESTHEVVCIVPESGHQLVVDRLDDSVELTIVEHSSSDVDSVPAAVAEADPDCAVVATEDHSRTRSIVRELRDSRLSIPIVVAPPDGSERLATAAVRADADDYVPISSGSVGERIDDVVRSANTSDEETDHGRGELADDDNFLGLLATELPDEAFVVDEEGRYLEARTRADSGDLYTVSSDELVGSTLYDAFDADLATELHDCVTRALSTGETQSIEYEAETTEGHRSFEARVHPVGEPVDGRDAVVWLARDVTARARRERDLRDSRSQLETVLQVNTVIGEVIQTLVEAPTRTEIERAACRELAASDLYSGAWVGELTGEESMAIRASAGQAERYLDAIDRTDVDVADHAMGSVDDGEIRLLTEFDDRAEIPEPLRTAADADGVRSEIVVPISHDETTFGVLGVVADRADAFRDHERFGFDLLGETMGLAINAVKNRRLLFADSVVELELQVPEGDTYAFDLTEEYDCAVSLVWAGTTARGRLHQYVDVEGLDTETAIEYAQAHDSVESCRLIHDGDDECTLEMRLVESAVRTLTNHGLKIQDVTVEDGVGTLLLEVPRDADVRGVLSSVRRIYDGTELIARRIVDRPVITAAERRERIVDELTDRQLTALRLAYYGGYFDWPRGSTGEEIAEAMDVSPPTMHQHLRKALQEVLAEFFDEHPPGGE